MISESWVYNGEEFNLSEEEIIQSKYIAFVYKIIFNTGEYYIGYKNFFSKRKGKKLISNWVKYTSSSKEINKRIKDKSLLIIKKEILHLIKEKRDILYLEAKELFKHDVLEDEKSLNKNILGRFYYKLNK